MALVAMATMAPAASAEMAEPPHRANSGDWTGITTFKWNDGDFASCIGSNCSFSDTATLRTKVQLFGVNFDQTCSVTLAGSLSTDGSVDASGSSFNCGFAPSQGRICRHKITGEYWLRLLFSPERPSFAQILTSPSGQATNVPTVFFHGAMFGNPATGAFADVYYTMSSGTFAHAYQQASFDEMWSASEIIAGPSESGAGCNWPELS
ncbi:MAG TPA: hypothetical protein VHF90_05085 [Thermoleophilaceae bacterium]|nr:hypothetical protein [Thermoleophilaceae bacterium]